MKSRPPSDRRFKAAGFALVELLIALALGLLLTIGSVNLFVSSKQSLQTEKAVSRNQENGRFAIDFLNRDIRVAGFIGCASLEDVVPNVVATNPPVTGFTLATALQGYDNNGKDGTGATWSNPSSIARVSGTDIIVVNHGGDCAADLTGSMGNIAANLQTESNSCDFQAGETLFITDCQSADLFRATSLSSTSGGITIAHAKSGTGNTSASLSKAYGTDASVLIFQQSTYFVGTAPTGKPALYRITAEGGAEEIVENIEDMQIVYGLDSGFDGIVDSYKDAIDVTDWSKVLSVAINFLVRSNDNATVQPQSLVFNGLTVNTGSGADKRLRTAFNTSIGVRNRIP